MYVDNRLFPFSWQLAFLYHQMFSLPGKAAPFPSVGSGGHFWATRVLSCLVTSCSLLVNDVLSSSLMKQVKQGMPRERERGADSVQEEKGLGYGCVILAEFWGHDE